MGYFSDLQLKIQSMIQKMVTGVMVLWNGSGCGVWRIYSIKGKAHIMEGAAYINETADEGGVMRYT